MDTNTKDQLIVILDNPAMCNQYHYSVEVHNRHHDSPKESVRKWSLRLIPVHGQIHSIDLLCGVIKIIDHLISISIDQKHGGCLLLF